MSLRVLVAGSGRMGRNVGLFFLRSGHAVDWISRDPGRLVALEKHVGRHAVLLEDPETRGTAKARAGFHLDRDAAVPPPDLVVEAVEEELAGKRITALRLVALAGPDALYVTTSSSFLPAEVHPRFLGAHFLFPLELVRAVEAVRPAGPPHPRWGELLSLLRDHGLRVFEQAEANAFWVNRILLPLQVACVEAVRAGHDPAEVDRASRSPLLAVGQLELLDRIGVDVAAAAVNNYARRVPGGGSWLGPLQEGLAQLLALGKRGAKARDGFLRGAPLPWARAKATEGSSPSADWLLGLFCDSCAAAMRQGQFTEADLDAALGAVYGAERPFGEVAAERRSQSPGPAATGG